MMAMVTFSPPERLRLRLQSAGGRLAAWLAVTLSTRIWSLSDHWKGALLSHDDNAKDCNDENLPPVWPGQWRGELCRCLPSCFLQITNHDAVDHHDDKCWPGAGCHTLGSFQLQHSRCQGCTSSSLSNWKTRPKKTCQRQWQDTTWWSLRSSWCRW